MKRDDLKDQPCSMARTVAVIGDRWTLMLLRDCFLGVRRFDTFQERLGISRTIIAERLKLLVDEGVLARVRYQDRPPRDEYRLTPKGFDLYPVVMSIVHWGNRHYAGEAGPPMLHRQRTCGPRSAAASHPVARHFARKLMTAHERASAAPRMLASRHKLRASSPSTTAASPAGPFLSSLIFSVSPLWKSTEKGRT